MVHVKVKGSMINKKRRTIVFCGEWINFCISIKIINGIFLITLLIATDNQIGDDRVIETGCATLKII